MQIASAAWLCSRTCLFFKLAFVSSFLLTEEGKNLIMYQLIRSTIPKSRPTQTLPMNEYISYQLGFVWCSMTFPTGSLKANQTKFRYDSIILYFYTVRLLLHLSQNMFGEENYSRPHQSCDDNSFI